MMRARLALSLLTLAIGCGDNDQTGLAEGIFGDLGEVMPAASDLQKRTFERGLEVATRTFRVADGAGPHFNVVSCVACHERPTFGGSAPRYRNFLLIGETLSDGSFTPTGVNGVQPQFTALPAGRFPSDPQTNARATRNAIPFFGVGLLAEIPEEEILANADPDDEDGDGISGRANFERGFVSRFGRKSQSVAIESFIRGPLFNHLGLTTNPLPDARRAELPVGSSGDGQPLMLAGDDRPTVDGVGSTVQLQVGAPDEPNMDDDAVPDPELGENDLFDLISFSMLLAAPRPDEPTAESELGRDLFDEANCSGCHIATLRGPRGLIPAYTDLLIHDMGSELDDGIRMGVAEGSEFRTAPLWGVAATGPWLHDGRADSLDQAIRMHGGEAEDARDYYAALSEDDREAVIAFLVSLGGSSQISGGLLAPDEPVADVGEYGGPVRELSGAELTRFERGRALFDSDTSLEGGLGPHFNGDSCRACHFQPTIGGAGPADVDVVRHAFLDDGGAIYAEPELGTIAHRHASAFDSRPPFDAAANFVERRQTPSLLGLGLIERIPRATIEALADPTDEDGDDISGRVNILSGDRLGRFGWKADVPTLEEFIRDAMSAELGVTVPQVQGLTFGVLSDSDDSADPEVSLADLGDILFYMQSLAPPPRTRTRPEAEDRGQQLFASVGCDGCHVQELRTDDDRPVRLYSDLLLHDVSYAGALGIKSGDADIREFRTAPLWGLATSAPYMHDGRAETVEGAIIAHDGEARDSRHAFLDLDAAARDDLLAFLRSL